jgi:hypothetical protein
MGEETDDGSLERNGLKDLVPIDSPFPLGSPSNSDPPNKVDGGKLDRRALKNPDIILTY